MILTWCDIDYVFNIYFTYACTHMLLNISGQQWIMYVMWYCCFVVSMLRSWYNVSFSCLCWGMKTSCIASCIKIWHKLLYTIHDIVLRMILQCSSIYYEIIIVNSRSWFANSSLIHCVFTKSLHCINKSGDWPWRYMRISEE